MGIKEGDILAAQIKDRELILRRVERKLKITKPWAKVKAEVEKIGKEITRKILEYSNEFLLDTSYVLPLVGIEVEEISGDIYSKILAKKSYYPLALVAELVGVIAKEVKRTKIYKVPEEVVEGFNSIIYGGQINVVLLE